MSSFRGPREMESGLRAKKNIVMFLVHASKDGKKQGR